MTRSDMIFVIVLNIAIGFVMGLIPLLLGYLHRNLRTGVLGIIVTTLGGGLLGVIVSLPAMAIFTWLIVRKAKNTPPADES